ncbi:hypothetical protein [Streptomyces sp. NPDC049881]|uniref:hypothetical protein n=1 Tax=Streptomyces sp. NPDC049881 TaxID=3155778 RepID=UPI003442EE31
MNRSRSVRLAATSLAAAALLSLAAPAAQAGTADYSQACRGEVAEARAWLTSLGHNPHTNDPKVVRQKLVDLVPLVSGQVVAVLYDHEADIYRECFQ